MTMSTAKYLQCDGPQCRNTFDLETRANRFSLSAGYAAARVARWLIVETENDGALGAPLGEASRWREWHFCPNCARRSDVLDRVRRRFTIGTVLSVVTGIGHTQDLAGILELCSFLLCEHVFVDDLPAALSLCGPALVQQLPALDAVTKAMREGATIWQAAQQASQLVGIAPWLVPLPAGTWRQHRDTEMRRLLAEAIAAGKTVVLGVGGVTATPATAPPSAANEEPEPVPPAPRRPEDPAPVEDAGAQDETGAPL